MLKKLTISLGAAALLCMSTGYLKAQDVHFSQIQEAPLWLNPANTGFFNGYLRAIANYRNQWAAMGNAYQTMSASLDAAVLKSRTRPAYLGLGLYIYNDQAGAAKLSMTQAQFHVSGIVQVGKGSKLGAGLYGGFAQNNANYNALTFGTQYNAGKFDNSLASGENVSYNSFITSDFGVGMNYEYSNTSVDLTRDDVFSLKIGGAIHHIAQPVQRYSTTSNYKLPMRYVGQVSSRIDLKGTSVSVLPSLIYLRQGTGSEINVGTHFRYRFKNGTKITGAKSESGLSIGAYYRVGDAIIPQVMLDFGNYNVGLSYDCNVSGFRKATRTVGGFEISFKYQNHADALFKRKREHGLN